MNNNPFNFDYMMFRYLYSVKDTISEETFSEVANYKLSLFIPFMQSIKDKLSVKQKMLFMDEMFSINRFALENIQYQDDNLIITGTLTDNIGSFYYPQTEIFFQNIEIISLINGYKERVIFESILKLPLILQSLQPGYNFEDKCHFADLYLSLDIYNPQFGDLIKRDSLSNISQLRFTYDDVEIALGDREVAEDDEFEENTSTTSDINLDDREDIDFEKKTVPFYRRTK